MTCRKIVAVERQHLQITPFSIFINGGLEQLDVDGSFGLDLIRFTLLALLYLFDLSVRAEVDGFTILGKRYHTLVKLGIDIPGHLLFMDQLTVISNLSDV